MALVIEQVDVSTHPEFKQHEAVFRGNDPDVGLLAYIAVHDTRLGPALGGTRAWKYLTADGTIDENAAITDVLRLSYGMTMKNAAAGLNLGGGKSVILKSADQDDVTEDQLRAFGRFLEVVNSKFCIPYLAAEDVGMSVAKVQVINEETRYLVGLPMEQTDAMLMDKMAAMGWPVDVDGFGFDAVKSGDPSPYTALGTFLGLKAAVKHAHGRDTLDGVRVGVQGLGSVGMKLCRHLSREGAKLFVTDISQDNLIVASRDLGAKVLAPGETRDDPGLIIDTPLDVFAPCALGAIVNDNTIDRMKTSVIAGAANNQLATEDMAGKLRDKGILYAPDYVINAGGVIAVYHDDKLQALRQVNGLEDSLHTIYTTAERRAETTFEAANRIALGRLENAANASDRNEDARKIA